MSWQNVINCSMVLFLMRTNVHPRYWCFLCILRHKILYLCTVYVFFSLFRINNRVVRTCLSLKIDHLPIPNMNCGPFGIHFPNISPCSIQMQGSPSSQQEVVNQFAWLSCLTGAIVTICWGIKPLKHISKWLPHRPLRSFCPRSPEQTEIWISRSDETEPLQVTFWSLHNQWC